MDGEASEGAERGPKEVEVGNGGVGIGCSIDGTITRTNGVGVGKSAKCPIPSLAGNPWKMISTPAFELLGLDENTQVRNPEKIEPMLEEHGDTSA